MKVTIACKRGVIFELCDNKVIPMDAREADKLARASNYENSRFFAEAYDGKQMDVNPETYRIIVPADEEPVGEFEDKALFRDTVSLVLIVLGLIHFMGI